MTNRRRALDSGPLPKSWRYRHKLSSASEVLSRVKAGLTYGWIEVNEGNPAAWILGQWIGRVNEKRPASPTTRLCFCFSTLHVLCNIAAPHTNTDNTIFFHNAHGHSLYKFIQKLGFRPVNASNLCVSLTLVVEALRGRRVVAWIPHLSPLDYTPYVRKLIRTLSRLQSVKHIDDGMGFISRDTLVYRQNYISPRTKIYSWDFLTAPGQAGFPTTSTRSCFERALAIGRWGHPSLINEGPIKIKDILSLNTSQQINIVLASKLLDPDLCLQQLGGYSPRLDTIYIPHYNEAKNSYQLASLYPNLSLSMPELGLLGIAQTFSCCIFFGVTVSAIILIELLLRTTSCQSLQLVFTVRQDCPAQQRKELNHFKALLDHYRNHQDLANRSISIVILSNENHTLRTANLFL